MCSLFPLGWKFGRFMAISARFGQLALMWSQSGSRTGTSQGSRNLEPETKPGWERAIEQYSNKLTSISCV